MLNTCEGADSVWGIKEPCVSCRAVCECVIDLILVQLGITPPPQPHKDKLKDRLEGGDTTSRAGFTEGNDLNGSVLG